ncbi:UNVERIFIED_ORG: hypothetical protein DFO82_1121 [Idiomarina abyssalis]|uniref:hypothetical protein n=1 Tax=Idiomarina sp. 017G TaxID=2183988 RepID=UPI000E0E3F99|nr:hypothetical protein [Idiomarina sp. 017G]TDO51882.1 hypothetical protein DEU30_10284 [Idiomarina sp. 017G]
MNLERIESKKTISIASLADLLTLVEQRKIVLFANIKSTLAIARRLAFPNEFVGMATASIDTFAPVSSKIAEDVIRKGESTLKRIRVRASELTEWNPEFPYDNIDDIDGLDDWEGTDFDTAKQKSVELLLEPTVAPDLKSLADLLTQLVAKKMNNENAGGLDSQKRLSSKGYKITKFDLFVEIDKLHEALNETSLTVNDQLAGWQSLSEQEIIHLIKEADAQIDPLNIILFRLLAAHPESPMKTLWAELESEHKNEIRFYDTEHLIEDFDIDALFWLNGRRTKRCSYRTAENRISQVKIAVNNYFSQKVS